MNTLQLISYRDNTLTLNDRLFSRSKVIDGASYGNTPLLDNSFSYDEVLNAFENYVNLGPIKQHWNEFVELFIDNVVYIVNENTVYYGKEAIKRHLKNRSKKVPKMSFSRIDWFEIEQNRVTFYIWNEMTSKSGKHYRLPQVSIIYYAGNGKWKFQEDFYDQFTFMRRIFSYCLDDLINGGEAFLTFMSNI